PAASTLIPYTTLFRSDRARDLVAANRARAVLGDVARGEEALRGEPGDDEPEEQERRECRVQPSAKRRVLDPQPDPRQATERPHLGPPERAEEPHPERHPVPSGEVKVDRREAQRDDH